MQFGQIVIGPPGSGKTTYCNSMKEFMEHLGRKVAVINIDPANDVLSYSPEVNISHLIELEDVMSNVHLGPNGALMYCMEYLEKNVDWLLKELSRFKDSYVLMDCPGQVELYTHHRSIQNIVKKLQEVDLQLAAVHLVDSHYCSDPGKFIAVALTSLSTMLWMELPHVNVLSKVDIIEKYGRLHYNIDFYTDVMDLKFLVDQFAEDPFMAKFKKLNLALTGIIEDYSLVSFFPLNIQEKKSMLNVLSAVDKANGYIFGQNEERNIFSLLSVAMKANLDSYEEGEVEDMSD